MESTMIQFRLSVDDKNKLSKICERLGMDIQTYIKICLKRMLQENGMPFSMVLENSSVSKAATAAEKMNAISVMNGTNKMSLDDINMEIQEARLEMKHRGNE